jgi:acetyl esterase
MPAPTVLEKEAAAFAEKNSKPPFLFDLEPEKGRVVVDDVQSSAVTKLPASFEDLNISGGPSGTVSLRIVRPEAATGPLPTILYIHGAGWVFGNAHTHDKLIRELAVRCNAAVVFPIYSLSPEAKYPTALEECYAALEWIAAEGASRQMDPQQIAIAGDSVGGNLAAAVTILAKQRSGPSIRKQLLFYPVTNAFFDTDSYHQFATGYFLRRDAMVWFWNQYTTDEKQRAEITASPLRATEEDLRDLPPALIITAEADVLRDEGEAYANKLRKAGVRVTAARFQATIHDFVMLNPLSDTAATRGAMDLATTWLAENDANVADATAD